MKRIFVASLLFLTLLCVNVYGYDIRAYQQGYSNGFHWEIVYDMDRHETGKFGLRVDGIVFIPCQNYAIDTVTIGKSLYFTVNRNRGELCELFDIVGERVIPFKFNLVDTGGRVGKLCEFTVTGTDPHTKRLYDSEFNLLKSNYWYTMKTTFDGCNGDFIEVMTTNKGGDHVHDLFTNEYHSKLVKSGYYMVLGKTFEGRDEKYIEVTYETGDETEQELYTTDWQLVLPRYDHLLQKKDDQGNYYYHIKDCNGNVGILDSNWDWTVPFDKCFSAIAVENINGANYYRCKKDGYWGLYDSNLNEIIAPEYEQLGAFDGTNFIKYKMNGFCGVMTLQGKVTKTIIPTTRGYTDISRYVKSQKRFTYEMNGYKGECNHLGQQVSKIKVNTPTTTTTSTSNSTSSSKSSSSSFSDNSSSDSSHLISFDYFKNPAGTKIKGKYTFTIEFKSDAVYFKLTNKKNSSSTTKTIYNFKLKELAYSATNNNIMVRFREGNKSHAFLFKKGYYDPVEHVETNLTTKQRTVTSYHQERENAHSVILSTLLFETTPTELFYDRLFEELSFYNGGCKIKLIDE